MWYFCLWLIWTPVWVQAWKDLFQISLELLNFSKSWCCKINHKNCGSVKFSQEIAVLFSGLQSWRLTEASECCRDSSANQGEGSLLRSPRTRQRSLPKSADGGDDAGSLCDSCRVYKAPPVWGKSQSGWKRTSSRCFVREVQARVLTCAQSTNWWMDDPLRQNNNKPFCASSFLVFLLIYSFKRCTECVWNLDSLLCSWSESPKKVWK